MSGRASARPLAQLDWRWPGPCRAMPQPRAAWPSRAHPLVHAGPGPARPVNVPWQPTAWVFFSCWAVLGIGSLAQFTPPVIIPE